MENAEQRFPVAITGKGLATVHSSLGDVAGDARQQTALLSRHIRRMITPLLANRRSKKSSISVECTPKLRHVK
jgi:hypothetical protein